MTKTLLIGLDAACWEYLNPLLKQNQMPVLNRLMQTGVWGTMASTMPPWTPAAWASIVTGKNPGKHGIFDMLWRRPGTYKFTPTTASSRRGTPFWKRLNDAGYRVGLVNVPFTYPPEQIDGFMVCGFGTPESAREIASPKEVIEWVNSHYPDFKPVIGTKFLRAAPPKDILQAEIEHQSQQVEIACRLADHYEVDVLVINLMLTDHANHKMPDINLVQEAYRRSDQDLKALIETFQPDNVLLISDHGSSRLKGDFLLNAWLRDHGYLVQVENGPKEKRDSLNWVVMEWLRSVKGWSGLPEQLARYLIRESLFYWPVKMRAKFLEQLNRAIPFAREHVMLNGVPDYQHSAVFPGSVYSGLIYLNIEGREESGIISKKDRPVLIQKLKAELSAIKDPETREPLFPNVYASEELYSGDALETAPDIILDSYSMSWNIRTNKHIPVAEEAKNRYFVDVANRSDFGWHSRDGIFVVNGEAFSVGEALTKADLLDIPATILHLYGIPVPNDYDGRVLSNYFSEVFSDRAIVYQDGDNPETADCINTLSQEENEELASHLRALGYLD